MSAQTPPVARLAMVTLDCAEVAPEVTFWAALLGWEVAVATDDYAMLTHGPARLGFGRVEGHVPPSWPDEGGRKQVHLDLAVDDLDEAAQRAVALGASMADPQPGETWRVLLDPAGHPFCLTDAAAWG
ncbi:VOC family protein [Nocardioides bruguierae]|uniref:VOC family protein n=1 Tax=Nocardioides bruguierae TaxID=2945102 RepID=UPI002020F829|nr:VOC family protein [Nocardioides bruguierae]MCL8026287.1 VOC family protein [Nocardioides bruguierae]